MAKIHHVPDVGKMVKFYTKGDEMMWQMFEACWPWSHYSSTVASLVADKQRLEESLKSAQDRIRTLLDLLDSGATILAEKKKVIATMEATMREITAANVDLNAQIEAKDHQIKSLLDWQATLRKKAEIGRRMFVQKWQRQKDATMGMVDEMDLLIEAIHKEGEE